MGRRGQYLVFLGRVHSGPHPDFQVQYFKELGIHCPVRFMLGPPVPLINSSSNSIRSSCSRSYQCRYYDFGQFSPVHLQFIQIGAGCHREVGEIQGDQAFRDGPDECSHKGLSTGEIFPYDSSHFIINYSNHIRQVPRRKRIRFFKGTT